MGHDGNSVNIRLEGDDVLSRDDVVLLGHGSSQGSWEQSSEEEGNVANVDHGGCRKDGPRSECWRPRLMLGY
jgi:hypothetical protein